MAFALAPKWGFTLRRRCGVANTREINHGLNGAAKWPPSPRIIACMTLGPSGVTIADGQTNGAGAYHCAAILIRSCHPSLDLRFAASQTPDRDHRRRVEFCNVTPLARQICSRLFLSKSVPPSLTVVGFTNVIAQIGIAT